MWTKLSNQYNTGLTDPILQKTTLTMPKKAEKNKSCSCIICQEMYNGRIVQCDTYDRWCHFDCVDEGDEINDISSLGKLMNVNEGTLSPMADYGTPPEQVDCPNMELQGRGGELNSFRATQGPVSPQAAAMTDIVSTIGWVTVPQVQSDACNLFSSRYPMYMAAATTNTTNSVQVLACTAVTQNSLLYNNNACYMSKQAKECTETLTNINGPSCLNSATMFQRVAQNVYVREQHIVTFLPFKNAII